MKRKQKRQRKQKQRLTKSKKPILRQKRLKLILKSQQNRRQNMPQAILMELKVLLPFGVFVEVSGVSRIVIDTLAGSFGLLPHRLDCAAALVPGILSYESEISNEVFVAVDAGVMVKTGLKVFVSV